MDNDVTSCTNVKAQLILTSYPWIKKKGWKTFEKKIENKKNNKNKEKKWELKENHGECECEKKGNGFLGFKSLLCESSRALCFLFPLVFTLHYEPDPITTWIVSLIWNCWKFVWVELIDEQFYEHVHWIVIWVYTWLPGNTERWRVVWNKTLGELYANLI